MKEDEIVLMARALDDQVRHVMQTYLRDHPPGQYDPVPRPVIKVHIEIPNRPVLIVGPFQTKAVTLDVISRFLPRARMVRFSVTVEGETC